MAHDHAFRIIETSDEQSAIDAAVFALNNT